MEGERILKSLLNGETDGLYDDTKNYLSPLQSSLNNKNSCKTGTKATEETIPKYTVFCAKFLRCAVETLKKVKAKGNSLDEITSSLNLVGTLLNNTLCGHNGNYLKFIPSLDQLGKTIYLIVVQLIGKGEFDRALGHASDLLKFIQLLKAWKNYDSEKMDKELASLALRVSDVLLQGAGKLEEIKITPAQRASHLCVVLEWRRFSILFQTEAILHSSLKSIVDRTLKCGTKYQVDSGQKNVNFKSLAGFFKSIFDALLSRTEQLISAGKDSLLLLVELGFHFGRICSKGGSSTQALAVFDKLLELSGNTGHCKNGHTKLQLPLLVCCCVCLVCKAAISLLCGNAKSQTQDACQQLLFESQRILSQILRCKMLPSPMLKLLTDALEYFRIILQNVCNKQTDTTKERIPYLSWRVFQGTEQLLQSYIAVLSLQCERLKAELKRVSSDDSVAQLRQQLQKTTDRQLGVLSFLISSYQDQLKSNKDAKNCSKESRNHILKHCPTVAQEASTLIHSALDDPDIPVSPNELRWLGCNVYNLGCVSYQRDCFAEGVPLLTMACEELRVWCLATEKEVDILSRTEEVKLFTKFALLTDCQRRAGQLRDALKTATSQVLISVRTSCDAVIIRQMIKQWTTVKHELVKSLQDEEKEVERSRTLCSALAEEEDAENIVGHQLCFVLQEELGCYKVKSYDTSVEQIAVVKQLMELYIVQEDEFHYGSSMLELAVSLHSFGDPGLEEERSSLDYCQEAVAILEQFVDKVASTGEDNTFYSSAVQDRVAAAYLWQALLEHKVTIEEKQTGQSPGLCENFEIDELEGICLEQGFMSSLYSALEMWTILVNRSVQKEPNGKIDLQHFSNPEESCHYLLITAGMFGVLNQPIKKVCALHLAGIISQAIGTVCMLENAVSAFSDAVHTMCDLLDIDHANVLLHNAAEMLDTFESSAATKVLFLLAKSHYLLITGKYSEGEDCLQEVLQSDVHTHKSYKSHLLKANLKSLCAKYSMVPAKQHVFTLSLDPVLGSMTALECAMDGFQKLSHMAEEIFGEDVFNSGKKKNQQKENAPGEGSLIMSSNKQSIFLFSLLDALLSSLLHVGQLYACQGAVREAFRQFVDGVALASHFALSYRIAEFLVNISQLELRQGKTDKCQNRLEQLKGILKPVLESSGEAELYEEGTEEPLFIRHPESCECVSCDDPALHVILVNYFMSLSKYLSSVSRHEQGVYILDKTETVCECTQKKMVKSLGRLDAILHVHCTGAVELKVKDSRKKGRAKTSKGKKQKVDTAVKNVTPQLMFSHHQVSLYCMKAQLMLQSGTVEKANNELSKAKEILQCVDNIVGNDPVFLLTEKATLLYLSGVAAMLSNSGCSGKVHIDYNWFTKHPTDMSGEGTAVVMDSVKGDSSENEIEKQRTGSTRRGRGSKPAENTHVKDDSKPKSTTAKGRGRRKKVEETDGECDKSDADLQQKTKGRKKPAKTTRTPKDVPDNKAAPEWVNKAIRNWNEAFDLCQAFPPPALFSDICLRLALCHGRSAPQLSMYYLNLCSSLTLRHQALTSTGKRIKRTAKEVLVSSSGVAECSKDINHLVEGLFSLSLDSDTSSEISLKTACKLKEYVKIRNLMKFNLLSDRSAESSSYPFSHEEMGLLQKIPKGKSRTTALMYLREWTVCTLETFKQPGSEETELIICRIRAGAEPVFVKINTTKGEEQIKENESKDVVMDLTKLFECSLMEEFNDLMSANVKSMSVDNTSEWWAQRTRLNTKMMTFLEKLEASWLGRWKGILLGQPVGKGCEDSVMKIARKLQQRIMCMCGCEPDVQMLEVIVSSSPHLSRKEINDAFAEITGTDPTSPSLSQLLHEFEDLTDGVFSCGDKGHTQHRNGSSPEMVSRHPVILILGKDIQHLPWESIPMLYDHPVTRVPSLQFLLSKVACQMQLTRVDPVKTFYALNPQNNLPNTQKMFQKWFESEHGWQGITGKAPTKEEFSKALTDHEMFIYFGHGTGREFLQGDDIQRLDCQAVTLLMGCSSGKLMVGGECEPRGMVLNYLLAGCPAIVANLWDVTDKDIDRFSESLLKQWLDPDTYLSLPEVLSQSRRACKLKYLIGASPVLYGLPVHIKT